MITFDQAVDAGCRYFTRHATVDLAEVASALAVSRATLYRVVSSRDTLLAEALRRLLQRTVELATARRTSDGIDGVLEVVGGFTRQLLASRPLRRFVAAEPQTATRLLTSPDGVVSRLAVDAAVRLFEDAGLVARRGGTVPAARRRARKSASDGAAAPLLVAEPDRVAFLLVRIVASLCFAEVAGTVPDPDLAEQTIRAMLVRACTPGSAPAAQRARTSRLMDVAMCLVWTSLPDLFADAPALVNLTRRVALGLAGV